jgi:hypothetical protein
MLDNVFYFLRHVVAYLDSVQARLASLRELQSASGEELRPLFGRTSMPSVLDRAFKGELCPPSRPSPKVGEGEL